MSKLLRLTITAVTLLALVAVCGYGAAKKKPVKAAPKAPAVKAPIWPKLLSIAAGQPFESVPSLGSSKLSVTLCAEETAPATFTVRYGRPLSGVRVAAADLRGPSKIGKENVTVRLVQGDNLVAAESIEIGASPAQLWVNVTVPKGSKAGLYKGGIGFYSRGIQIDVEPIEITVRPIRLIGSSKQYALYTCIGLSGQGASCLDCDGYTRFLANAAKLGFRAVSVNAEPARIGEALGACASVGLLGNAPVISFASGCSVPTPEDVKAVDSVRKAAGLGSAFYFCASEPATEEEVSAAVEKANVFKRAGMQVGVTVSDDATAKKLLPVVDGINYRYDMPYVQALINGGSIRTSKWEWYWWDARQSAADNRIRAGVALWRSGLYGCMPYWMPKGADDRADNLGNLQCEALREGVNDTRYITTYMKALRELKDKKRMQDKDYIAATEAYLAAFMAKPLEIITPADLRAFRAKMAEFSAKLGAML